MSTDYNAEAIEAARALAEDGQIVVLSWQTIAPYVPGLPEPEPVQHVYTAAGLVEAYPARDTGTQPDSLIAAGDERLHLAALAPDLATPVPEIPVGAMVLLHGGHTRVVKNCKALAPAGIVVLYDVTLKRPG